MHERGKLGRHIEGLILLCLIVLEVLDFIGWLSGDIDYIKKVISWTALAYVFYKVGISRVFFGQKHRAFDGIVIVSYFLLFLKDLVGIASISIKQTHYLTYLYLFVLENSVNLERYTFYSGIILIVIISVYSVLRFQIKENGLMKTIFGVGPPPKRIYEITSRAILTAMALMAFFILVFNLGMEWLAVALDTPLVVFGIFFYLFIIVGRREKFAPETLLYRIGNYGEGFYEKFIKAFHSKRGLFLSVSGLLVLHLLTEIGFFVIPQIFGFALFFGKIIYYEISGISQLSVAALLKSDISTATSLSEKIGMVWIYGFNVVAILFMLIGPAFIWYNYYKNRGFYLRKIILSLFFTSFVCFLLAPVFGLRPIDSAGLVGVEIYISSILPTKLGLNLIVGISIAAGLFVFFMGYSQYIKHKATAAAITLILLFFALYIFYYFLDTYRYYIGAIRYFFSTSEYFFGISFMVFLFIILVFYVAGYIIFLSETQREYRRIS